MEEPIQLLLALVLIGLAAFFAAAETAAGTVRRGRLQQLEEDGDARARRARDLLRFPEQFVATAQIGGLAAILLGTTLGVRAVAPGLAELVGSRLFADLLVTLVFVGMVMILAQYLPRAAAVPNAEAIALGAALPLRCLQVLLYPIVWLMAMVSRQIHRAYGVSEKVSGAFVTEADIKIRVDAGAEEGVIEEEEREMIHSIFEIGNTVAREIMVPRIDLVAAETAMSVREALDLSLREGHSRLPVYEDSIDRIVGVLYVKDAVRLLLEGQEGDSVRDILRPAYFVPESKKLDELLHEMQQRKVHLSIVVDEYGGTAGVVTIEDILEEIVGEIQDEFDVEEAAVQPLGPHELLVEASLSLDDLCDLTGLRLKAEDVGTVGGYVYHGLGRVPSEGDELSEDGVRLVVAAVEGNRIKKVRIVRTAPSQAGEEGRERPPEERRRNGGRAS